MPDLSDSPPALIEAKPLWIERGPARPKPSRRIVQRLCDLAMLATAAAHGVPSGEICAATRRAPSIALARQSAMYLAHVAFGLTYSEVGRAFGRDRTTAAHACRLIEERRDDPAIDAMLAPLEDACGALRRRLAAPVQS